MAIEARELDEHMVKTKLETVFERLTELSNSTKSHFQAAFFLVPGAARRQALDDFYRYCRILDDLSDDMKLPLNHQERHQLLKQIEMGLISGEDWGLDFWKRFQNQKRNYDYPQSSLQGIIEGVKKDIGLPSLQINTWNELDQYVQGVAVCVGEVILAILGLRGEQANHYAKNLGRYVQYLNIMRDLEEDYREHRIYIPQEFLDSTDLEWGAELIRLARAELYARALRFRKEARPWTWRCFPCEALVGIYTYASDKYWRFGNQKRLRNSEKLFSVLVSFFNFLLGKSLN